MAHFFTMWGFFILGSVYVEAFGQVVDHDFHIPIVGRWDALGFLQDFFAVAVLLGIITFAIIRIVREPKKHGRDSRFYGSHTGGAWLILFMIFNVIWTYALVRGAGANTGALPYGNGAFFSHFMGWVLHPFGESANEWIETFALLGHIAVMLIFLSIVLHSKHLHIGLAPVNVTFKRLPNGLGPLLPVEYNGERIDFEDPAEDAILGRGKIEDFSWKGWLDFTTCTECGRCQSQCPAWNTGKPLSPKLLIMSLRDHRSPRLRTCSGEKEPLGPAGHDGRRRGRSPTAIETSSRTSSTVPAARRHAPGPEQPAVRGEAPTGRVIDTETLWSCTSCGACVEQCPVDIEHVDHIIDMRRYQVLIESDFPTSSPDCSRTSRTRAIPGARTPRTAPSGSTRWTSRSRCSARTSRASKDSNTSSGSVAPAPTRTAPRRPPRPLPSCSTSQPSTSWSSARARPVPVTPLAARATSSCSRCWRSRTSRCSDELFATAPQQKKKIVVTCAHCFNALGNEYPQVGGTYEVVHHTQLLNRLVRDKRLIPVAEERRTSPTTTPATWDATTRSTTLPAS